MTTLRQLLSAKTDEQLKYYILNVDKHTIESVSIALEILRTRNVSLPDDIDQQIEDSINLKNKSSYDSLAGWNEQIVNDANAPEYYSQRAIYTFSILFSVLFGAVMLAVNLKNTHKAWGWPILFGLIFTAGAIFLGTVIGHTSTGIALVINAAGVAVMYQLFWNKQIGKETKYRAKPIWIPLIVGLLMMVPIIYFTVYA